MFNLGIGELTLLALLALAFLARGSGKQPSLIVRRRGRSRRDELLRSADEARGMDRLDWLLLITGLALALAVAALLSRP